MTVRKYDGIYEEMLQKDHVNKMVSEGNERLWFADTMHIDMCHLLTFA